MIVRKGDEAIFLQLFYVEPNFEESFYRLDLMNSVYDEVFRIEPFVRSCISCQTAIAFLFNF